MKIKHEMAVWVLLFFSPQNLHGDGGTTVKKQGDIMLKGMFPITFRDEKTGKCDELDTTNGLLWMMAMTYAVEEINNSTSILPNVTLGYEIDDTCRNIPTAMGHAIDIVAKYRPNSVCLREGQNCGVKVKAKKRPVAVIGPATSWISIPVASLMALYDILQISYASTSRILSDKSRYKSFMRTVPSDEYQAEAMADFVHQFEWSYVFLIASDDDYGKMGAAAFKASAKKLNICIAYDEFIAFTAERSDEIIRNTLTKLKRSPRTKVVIVFSYLEQGERLLKEANSQNITDRTWVTSDAWSNGVTNLNISKATLVGLFTFSIKSGRLRGFEHYLRSFSVHEAQTNFWWSRFLEEELGCQITNQSARYSNVRSCDPHERLPADRRFGSDVIVNVIDAVHTAAHAIHAVLLKCEQLNLTCSGGLNSIPADLLLASAKNVSFTSADGGPIRFSEAGDVTTIKYVIRNVQLDADEALTYVEVGAWNITDGEKDFSVDDQRIVWNSRTKPQSTCFRECRPGERVVGQSECCWNCQKCEKGTVSSVAGSFACNTCNETHYANQGQTLCLERHVVYLRPSHPAAVTIIALSCIGIICTAVIAVIFVRMRKTAVLVSCSASLVMVFFFTLLLSFVFAAAQVSVPSHKVCVALDTLLHLLLIMYAAFLLANTKAITRALMSAVSRLINMRVAYVHAGFVGALVLLQVVLILLWQVTAPSVVRLTNQDETSRVLDCKADFPAARIVATVFPLLVLLLATIVSFHERNFPENFNEAKFISFATIALCILLVAFFPTYWYVFGITRILVVAFTVFVAAFSCMGCIFIPKLYIIFMRPKRNTAQAADTKNDDRTLQPATCPNKHLKSNLNNHSSNEQMHPATQDITTANILKERTQLVRFDLDPVPEQSGEQVIGSSNSGYEKDEDSAHAPDIVSL